MNICRLSITRPVAVIVLMLSLILFGYLSLRKLPVREYPNIDTPMITVVTQYEGASSDVVETKITQPIENALAGIDGLDNISSTSKEGKSKIDLEFSMDKNIDVAANDVRDRINRVQNKLPDGADTPVVKKHDSSAMPIMRISITDPNMSQMELSDYADRYIIDKFSVIDGVASIDLMGNYEQSMRIWLDRKEMASRKITVKDITNALLESNVEYPTGRLESIEKDYSITLESKCRTPEDFRKIIVARDENNKPIYMGDIAKINIEPKSQRSLSKVNDRSVITFGISKQSTANTLAITENARKIVDKIQKQLPKNMKLTVLSDDSTFIKQSISEVFFSMLLAAIFVFIIVFVFIGSIKAALIPTITVPISLIATCIVLQAVGASLNMLTLLAMVLAVGIVVDDAILVLENIQRRIDDGEESLLAAFRGSNQVFFAVISTTVVLLAVFLPIGMLPGKTGKLFTEFSIAMSAAVCFSSLIALTLTPMLCSKLLSRQKISRFNQIVDVFTKISQNKYRNILEKIIKYSSRTVLMFALLVGSVIFMVSQIPGEYEPKEDRNMLMVDVAAQEGIGFYAMQDYMESVAKIILPLLDDKIAENVLMMIPGFGGDVGSVNGGKFMINLFDHEKRDCSVFELMKTLNEKMSRIPAIKGRPILPMGISSKGSYPVQFIIGGYDYKELAEWRDIIFSEVAKSEYISNIDSNYKETTPKLRVTIDKDRAGDLGISTATIGSTLEVMLGSKNVTTFVDRGQEYDVILQANKRKDFKDISNIYVRSDNENTLIPLDNLISIRAVGEAEKLCRYNRARSITISGNVAPGHVLSEAIDFLENVVKEKIPLHAQIYYKGQTKDYKESQGGIVFVFIMAMLVSYFVLAAQFESFVSPFIVMLSVPLGVFGAILSMYLFGYTMNIYTQIGLIMLIGLSAKQGILIVEFANQLRGKGIAFREALIQASVLRFRPMIMTGISTVIGAVPLLLARGASAASRQNLGIVEVFGGLSGVLLTLIVIPVGYFICNFRSSSPYEIENRLKKQERNSNSLHDHV